MQVVYPKLSDTLVEYGHEIGIHGKYHEYLSELDKEQQSIAISEMVHDWKREIIGANFIGRMNQDTIKALIKNHVKYCVFPHINYYSIMSYPKLSTEIYSIQSDAGKLIMIPIAVETYGSPWFSIKNILHAVFYSSVIMIFTKTFFKAG